MDMHVPQEFVAYASAHARGTSIESTEFFFSEQLSSLYDRNQCAMWLRWNPSPRPNFNPDLLRDLDRYCDFMNRSHGTMHDRGKQRSLEYAVLASNAPGVFNLGGDLKLFKDLIDAQDRNGLLAYGRACVKVLYRNYVGYGLPITTISLVQGECLGGGFEAALSSDVIVAERHARFGFPEIIFNLFPGMGAYSFLERRIGKHTTEKLLCSGRLYRADDMLALGVVDLVVDTGSGETEVANLIRSRNRNRNARTGIAAARRRVHRLDCEELLDVVEIWVDTALNLGSRDLKLMQRLVSRQNDFSTLPNTNVPVQQLH